MDDRFKLRVWDKAEDKMHPLVFDPDGQYGIWYEDEFVLYWDIDHLVTTMQSTGRKDSKGILIFESDKIDEYDGVIIFKDAAFYVDHVRGNSRERTLLSDWIKYRARAGHGTLIIGNIHEHPELLGKV